MAEDQSPDTSFQISLEAIRTPVCAKFGEIFEVVQFISSANVMSTPIPLMKSWKNASVFG